jgi:hypothetical protein
VGEIAHTNEYILNFNRITTGYKPFVSRLNGTEEADLGGYSAKIAAW